jgi:antitoxin component of RelBE/YafQ-DinJ toxin-antitoxin module
MQDEIITFKVSEDFKNHIKDVAKKKKLTPSAYIKAVIKKHSKFKDKPLV